MNLQSNFLFFCQIFKLKKIYRFAEPPTLKWNFYREDFIYREVGFFIYFKLFN